MTALTKAVEPRLDKQPPIFYGGFVNFWLTSVTFKVGTTSGGKVGIMRTPGFCCTLQIYAISYDLFKRFIAHFRSTPMVYCPLSGSTPCTIGGWPSLSGSSSSLPSWPMWIRGCPEMSSTGKKGQGHQHVDRLLHNPSFVSVGLSFGYKTWPLCDWVIWILIGKHLDSTEFWVICNVLWAHVTFRNSRRFLRPMTVRLHGHHMITAGSAVQGDYERV